MLLLIVRLFPGAAYYIAFGKEDESYLFGFGGVEPLRGVSLTFAGSAAIVFWALALLLTAGEWRECATRRERVSSFLVQTAVATMLFVVPMLAAVWALAWKDGHVPTGPWGVSEGNHGPWRHAYNLRKLLSFAFWLPLVAIPPAIPASAVTSGTRAFALVCASLAAFLGVLWSHYWLID